MPDVVTLTMNPAIDLSVSVERVTPFLLPYIVTASKVGAIFWCLYSGPFAVPATLHRRVGRERVCSCDCVNRSCRSTCGRNRRREGAAAPRSAAVTGKTLCRLCRFARGGIVRNVSSASSRATDGGATIGPIPPRVRWQARKRRPRGCLNHRAMAYLLAGGRGSCFSHNSALE
jgi:hypothetical protein